MKTILLSLFIMTSGVALARAELPTSISKVYSYQCTKRFFEGEGVGSNAITCLANQHLGFYAANYTYYLFESENGDNFGLRGTTQSYRGDICGMGIVDRYTCSAENKLEFGLSAVPTRKFNVKIGLNPRPVVAPMMMGWAALPVNGECEEGLVKIRPYKAYPPTLMDPLPSNFINFDHHLDSFAVSTDDRTLDPFVVNRIPSTVPCDAHGICSWPTGESVKALELPYEVAEGPLLCVVPAGVIK